jgi:hypothetical protein
MPTNRNRDQARNQRGAGIPCLWLGTMVAIAATAIAFRRFASNERVACAVAVGVVRRRGESAAPEPLTSESSPK